MFSKVLVANRGEIAIRIIKACKNMGIKTVAIYSEVDKGSLHTLLADEKFCIGPASVKNSYINKEAIITLAQFTNSDAIHPGYGFLSESDCFSMMCKNNNITFIGPSYEVINKVSNKYSIKNIAKSLKIPVAQAYLINNYDIEEINKIALQIGFPVIIKLLNGGGGVGLHIIKNSEELKQLTKKLLLYPNNTMYIEKYMENVKHIEVQILGDNYGEIKVIGDRDCSIQINNKKIIEESPALTISNGLRKKLYESSYKIAKAVKYSNAGTVEFLVDENEIYYFMEFNARLQVEHGITELTAGIDIVKWQILIASGERLTIEQNDIKNNGHAIECRINANTYGHIVKYKYLEEENIRYDHMLMDNANITPCYDNLICKIMVHDSDRIRAIEKMKKVLDKMEIIGIETNLALLSKIMNNSIFHSGVYNTNFIHDFSSCKNTKRAREKIYDIVDVNSFKEFYSKLTIYNIISFANYDEKIRNAKLLSGEPDGVIAGIAKINNIKCVIFILEPLFLMGTMGSVEGEKITKAFEYATYKRLPIISIAASGGARMQEGVFSLFQMAKTAGVVKKHSDKGLLYISVITNPTLGGVSASFASLADIIIAEEDAIFGFTGRRIIEETIKYKLSDNFQTAEYAKQNGQIDRIVKADELRNLLVEILCLHSKS